VAFESSADSTLDQSAFQEQSNLPTPKHEFQVHQQWTSSFVFLDDNVHIVSGADNGDKGTMHKWDCKTGLLVGEPWVRKSRGIRALALSPDGKTIACSGAEDRTILRWNIDGEIVKGIWPDDGDPVGSLSWSPCGGRLASGSRGGIILIRNAENEGEDVEVGPIKTNQGWIYALAYSPLGDKVASGGTKGTIYIWDSNTGEILQGPIDDLGSVFSIVWSWDGSKIYSADRFVRVLDSNSGAELHRFENFNGPYSIALSPKHSLLAAVGHDGAAQLWDTESHQPLGHSFHHEDHQKLTRVSFSQDGQYLAYCGLNYKITLWMVKDIIPKIEVRASIDRN
jgi:WD40 repeat protein